jgi:hypothetical protein
MLDVLQILGALGVLIPFVGSQMGRMSLTSPVYLGLNFAGSAVLAALALHGGDWGFLLLEGVWALVALRGLIAPAVQRLRST